ncbi:MAG: 3-methyl-2-oxobutanoate hydroxymethyltransferase [Bacteriovoracaceae bacterium]|nr:3-methyl-2-oxobutanoate hydroxymethyltransferase [Bacteriovoracaceae bacterium]
MKMNTRQIRAHKNTSHFLHMLTCYDFQTAQMLNETEIPLLLVGDSVGNVVLGYDHTISVTLEEMIIFSRAVKRGAPHKFIVADLPFGTYSYFEQGIENATKLFQQSGVEALKLEGAESHQLDLIKRLTQIGIPVMGHLGLTPQSVHEQGGYYTHGKTASEAQKLLKQAQELESAGVFAVVLECVQNETSQVITQNLNIPTIGIGSGNGVDGQVLVLNDLLGNGKNPPPAFCKPMANFFELKKNIITDYLRQYRERLNNRNLNN